MNCFELNDANLKIAKGVAEKFDISESRAIAMLRYSDIQLDDIFENDGEINEVAESVFQDYLKGEVNLDKVSRDAYNRAVKVPTEEGAIDKNTLEIKNLATVEAVLKMGGLSTTELVYKSYKGNYSLRSIVTSDTAKDSAKGDKSKKDRTIRFIKYLIEKRIKEHSRGEFTGVKRLMRLLEPDVLSARENSGDEAVKKHPTLETVDSTEQKKVYRRASDLSGQWEEKAFREDKGEEQRTPLGPEVLAGSEADKVLRSALAEQTVLPSKLGKNNDDVLKEYAKKIREKIIGKDKVIFTDEVDLVSFFKCCVKDTFRDGVVVGVPDAIAVDSDGNIEIYDFKLKKAGVSFDNEGNWHQLYTYKAIFEALGFTVTKVAVIPIYARIGKDARVDINRDNRGREVPSLINGEDITITIPEYELSDENRKKFETTFNAQAREFVAYKDFYSDFFNEEEQRESITQEDWLKGKEEIREIAEQAIKSSDGAYLRIPYDIRTKIGTSIVKWTSATIDDILSSDNIAETLEEYGLLPLGIGSETQDTLSKKSRQEMIEFIGINNLLSMVTEWVLDEVSDKDPELGILLQKNKQLLLLENYPLLQKLERVSIKLSRDGSKVESNALNDSAGVDENIIEGSESEDKVPEYWTVNVLHISAVMSLSQEVNRALALLEIGEDSELGIPLYADEREVASTLFKWLSGCDTFSDMILVLEGKKSAAPFVAPLLQLLNESNSNFKSKFFSNFKKNTNKYSKVIVETLADGSRRYTPYIINTLSSRDFILNHIKNAFATGGLSNILGSVDIQGAGEVNTKNIKEYKSKLTEFSGRATDKSTIDDKEYLKDVTTLLNNFGIMITPDELGQLIFEDKAPVVATLLNNIVDKFNNAAERKGKFNPMERQDEYTCVKEYEDIATILSDIVEERVEANVYEGGKTYYAFQNSSKLTNLISKLSGGKNQVMQYVKDEYKDNFFRVDDKSSDCYWLDLALKGKLSLDHKIQINFGNTEYRDLGSVGYPLSLMAEFFKSRNVQEAWYATPIMGNKPSLEFIRAERISGDNWKPKIASIFAKNIRQECYRIRRVLQRANNNTLAKVEHYDISKPGKLTPEFLEHIASGKVTLQDLRDNKSALLSSGGSFKFFGELNDILFNENSDPDSPLIQGILKEINGDYENNMGFLNTVGTSLLEKDGILDTIVKRETEEFRRLGLFKTTSGAMTVAVPMTTNQLVHVSIPGITKYKYLHDFHSDTLQEKIKKIFEDNKVLIAPSQLKDRLLTLDEVVDTNVATKLKEAINKVIQEDMEEQMANYILNYMNASINIIQLTVTDLAYFKNMNDFQKRFAMLHSPGIRCNTSATFNGERVSDGKMRVVHIVDDDITSDISYTVDSVMQTAIERAGQNSREGMALQAIAKRMDKALKKSFDATDGQGWVSPTGFRKKMQMLGRWRDDVEEVAYQRIIKGDFTSADLAVMIQLQAQKPIIMTTVQKQVVSTSEESVMRVPLVVKDSEVCLFLASALVKGSKKDSKIAAIFDFMEESHLAGRNSEFSSTKPGRYVANGIDTIAYGSTSKFGKSGAVDIGDAAVAKVMQERGLSKYDAIKFILENAVYKEKKASVTSKTINGTDKLITSNSEYNYNYVNEFSFDDFAYQQEVPMHFQDETQSIGSQFRILNMSGFRPSDTIIVRGVEMSAKEAWDEYEDLTAENIEDSIAELKRKLKIDHFSESDANLALSKILRENILKDSKWGYDLYRACGVENTGTADNPQWEFVVPLTDPMHGNRVAQLIHSIFKKSINKQDMAGGPVVQAAYLDDDLEVSFIGSNGKKLLSYNRWLLAHNKEDNKANIIEYKQYLKDNKARFSHWDVIVTCPSKDLENILVEAAEKAGKPADYYMTNLDKAVEDGIIPDSARDIIGYRIPTEDKYSMAPMKAKSFLSRVTGEVIFMPREVVLLTGSDFDIDKMYLMVKNYDYKERYRINKKDLNDDEVGKIWQKARELHPDYFKKIEFLEEMGFSQKARLDIWNMAYAMRDKNGDVVYNEDGTPKTSMLFNFLKNARGDKNIPINSLISSSSSNFIKQAIFRAIEDDVDFQKNHPTAGRKITDDDILVYKNYIFTRAATELNKTPDKVVREGKVFYKLDEEKITKEGVKKGKLFREAAEALGKTVSEKEVISKHYTEIEDLETREGRLNRLFDLSWGALTAPESAVQMFNPGGFDEAKRVARVVTILRSGIINPQTNKPYTREELQKISESENGLDLLTDIAAQAESSLNITRPSTQYYYQRQNMTAAKLIGIFANHNVSHAFLQHQNINWDPEMSEQRQFCINGMNIANLTLDDLYDISGQNLIGRNIAEFLAASVDAVKDPVLNYFNMDTATAGSAMLLIRSGFSIETVGLFMGQPILRELVSDFHEAQEENEFTKLGGIINDKISSLLDTLNKLQKNTNIKESDYQAKIIAADNSLNDNSLSENLSKDMQGNMSDIEFIDRQLQVLIAFKRMYSLSSDLNTLVFLTKFNSVNNAAGPNIEDTLEMQFRIRDFMNKTSLPFTDNAKDAISNSKMLNAFYKDTVKEGGALHRLLARHFIAFTSDFNDILQHMTMGMRNYPNAKLIKKAIADYSLYLMTLDDGDFGKAVFDFSDEKKRKLVVDTPKVLVRLQAEMEEKGINNLFLKGLEPKAPRRHCPCITIGVNKAMITNKERLEEFRSNFAELLNYIRPDQLEKIVDLVQYTYFRGSMQYNPNSYAHVVPVDVLLAIPGYIKRLREVLHTQTGLPTDRFLDQFRRNNWKNGSLVPNIESGEAGIISIVHNDQNSVTIEINNAANNTKIRLDDYAEGKHFIGNHYRVIRVGDDIYQIEPSNLAPAITAGTYRVKYKKIDTLGIPNNFVEYDANTRNEDLKSIFLGKDSILLKLGNTSIDQLKRDIAESDATQEDGSADSNNAINPEEDRDMSFDKLYAYIDNEKEVNKLMTDINEAPEKRNSLISAEINKIYPGLKDNEAYIKILDNLLKEIERKKRESC